MAFGAIFLAKIINGPPITEPYPITVTRTAAETISGERKAIENAKTGKVTAVVTVMYLNGKTKVNLLSTNS